MGEESWGDDGERRDVDREQWLDDAGHYRWRGKWTRYAADGGGGNNSPGNITVNAGTLRISKAVVTTACRWHRL